MLLYACKLYARAFPPKEDTGLELGSRHQWLGDSASSRRGHCMAAWGRPAEVISKNYGVCLRGCRSVDAVTPLSAVSEPISILWSQSC